MGGKMSLLGNSEIDKFRAAGRIAARALQHGLALIEPGASHLDVSSSVEEEIDRLGGKPAFPAQISLNNIAAHYCSKPGDPLRFSTGDVAKLDVGVQIDGYVGDTAATRDLGGHGLLVDASRQALQAAIRAVGPDVPIREASRAIQTTIVSLGFKPVSNLTGHGLGRYQVHTAPQVPNVLTHRSGIFRKGMIVAIEPFATDGSGTVNETGQPEIFSARRKIKLHNGADRDVAETIAAFKNLPFARRNLTAKHGLDVVERTLKVLLRKGILQSYPPLAEKPGIFVSQAEHTLFIGDTVEILTLPD